MTTFPKHAYQDVRKQLIVVDRNEAKDASVWSAAKAFADEKGLRCELSPSSVSAMSGNVYPLPDFEKDDERILFNEAGYLVKEKWTGTAWRTTGRA